MRCAAGTRIGSWRSPTSVRRPNRLPTALPADVTGYLPYDRPRDVGHVSRAPAPTVAGLHQARPLARAGHPPPERGVPVGLIAGTVRPKSGRLRWPVRRLLDRATAALDAVGAASTRTTRPSGSARNPDRTASRFWAIPRYDSVAASVAACVPGRSPAPAGSGRVDHCRRFYLAGDDRCSSRHSRTAPSQRPTPGSCWSRTAPPSLHGSRRIPPGWACLAPLPGRRGASDSDPSGRGSPRELATLYGAGKVAYVGGGFGTRGPALGAGARGVGSVR